MVLPPSSWRQATVHRTVGFIFRILTQRKKQKQHKLFLLFWSECRDSNSRPLEPHSSAIPNFATPGYFVLEECPICRGNGFVVHEGGWNVQVECSDCSAHTVYVEYETEEEKIAAEQQVVCLWNLGKVIKSDVGE